MVDLDPRMVRSSRDVDAGSTSSGAVIGFYGWKGGAGRTLLVANLAVALARTGKRVLAIDLDLEAPGLGDYFDRYSAKGALRNTAFRADGGWRNRNGFLELLNLDPNDSNLIQKAERDIKALPSVIAGEGVGELRFLGSARRPGSERYAYWILQADWDRFFSSHGGHVLEQVRKAIVASADVVLVDLRTGLSQFTFQIFARMLDKLVIVTPSTHQAARGFATAADVFAYTKPTVPAYVVLSDLHLDPNAGTEFAGAQPPASSAPAHPGSDASDGAATDDKGSSRDASRSAVTTTGSAEGLIELALQRMLKAEERTREDESTAPPISIDDRLFRLPRLETQDGSEALLDLLPPPPQSRPDSRKRYLEEGNRLAEALGLTPKPFSEEGLTKPGTTTAFGLSSLPPNKPTPGIDRAIISHTIPEIQKFLDPPAPEPSLPGERQADKGGSPADRLRAAIEGAIYGEPAANERPFGVRPLIAARLAQPFLSRAHYRGDKNAQAALEALGLDVLEEKDIRLAFKACRAFIDRVDQSKLEAWNRLFGPSDVDAQEASRSTEETQPTDQAASNDASEAEASGATPTDKEISEIMQALGEAAGDSRHPWRALKTLSEALEHTKVGGPYKHRVAEVRISLFSNAENHLGALEELLSLPARTEERAMLKALEGKDSYAAQLYRAIQGAFGSCLDSMAGGADETKALGIVRDGVDRLAGLALGRSYPAIIERYRTGLELITLTGRAPALADKTQSSGEKTPFDAFFDEALLGEPPEKLKQIEIDLDALDPRHRAFVLSARGEPALAFGARLVAVKQALRPNESFADNPRHANAQSSLGVMAARAGAVHFAFTIFDDLIGTIPDLYAKGASRDDSWIQEDIQHERRQLLLYRAHCHWMAGDLEKATADLAAARDAHRRYSKARKDDPSWAIRPLPAFHVMLEARLAYDRAKYKEALDASKPLLPIYRALVPIDGIPAIERLASYHRLRARANRGLGKTKEALGELEASLEAANLAPEGNPGPDADRAEVRLLGLCWGDNPDAKELRDAFRTAREAIDAMIRFELPDGLLAGPHESSFRARSITLAMDCLEANRACNLAEEARDMLDSLRTVSTLKPLCDRLEQRLNQLDPKTVTNSSREAIRQAGEVVRPSGDSSQAQGE